MVAIKHSFCEFDNFYWVVIIEKTSMGKYRLGGGATMTEHDP